MARIVGFGDEFGLPLILDSVAPLGATVLSVFDGKRAPVYDWVKKNSEILTLPHPERNSRTQFLNAIREFSPDLAVVFSYSRILWPELIDSIPKGIINFHFGRLPQYRGTNVIQWQMINGETAAWITAHYVDLGVDTGPVISELPVPIYETDEAVDLRARMMKASQTFVSDLLRRAIESPQGSRLPAISQNSDLAHKWPRRTEADGAIDWSWSDKRIYDFIRALAHPWPGAFCVTAEGGKVRFPRRVELSAIKNLRRTYQL